VNEWTKQIKSAVEEIEGAAFTFDVIDNRAQLGALEELSSFRVCSDLSESYSWIYKPCKLQVEPFMDGKWPAWKFWTTADASSSTPTDEELQGMYAVRCLADRINDKAQAFEDLPASTRTLDRWTEDIHKATNQTPRHRQMSIGGISTANRVKAQEACQSASKEAERGGEQTRTHNEFRPCDSSRWISPKQRKG
jgi:hypothetical protein